MKLFPIAFAILFGTVIAQLRLHHIQTTGTHNSYHIAPTPATVHWNYTRLDLAVQLSTHGIRRVELDILPNGTEFRVLHFTTYDEVSNCRNLTECTTKLRDWSFANPGHGPVFVMIGPKINTMSSATWLNYENILNSVFSPGHILTPDMVRGANANLRDQIVSVGWPLFNDTRGKFIFYISGGYGNYNSGAYAGSKGRTSFVSYGPTQTSISDCAMILMDSPSVANISAILSQNFLVSTRADGDYFPGAENLPVSAINAQYFAVADRDQSNLLTTAEVSSFTASLGINLSQQQLNTLISICASGQTSFNEAQWNCAMNTISGLGYNAIPTSPSFAEVTNQRNAAYASGAHIIDTDYPLPPFPGASQSTNYWANTPGGNYYRCNPVTTQGMSCTDADFELNPQSTTGQSSQSGGSSSSGQATGSGTSTGQATGGSSSSGTDIQGTTTEGEEASSSS